jgi:hypothetical protein
MERSGEDDLQNDELDEDDDALECESQQSLPERLAPTNQVMGC